MLGSVVQVHLSPPHLGFRPCQNSQNPRTQRYGGFFVALRHVQPHFHVVVGLSVVVCTQHGHILQGCAAHAFAYGVKVVHVQLTRLCHGTTRLLALSAVVSERGFGQSGGRRSALDSTTAWRAPSSNTCRDDQSAAKRSGTKRPKLCARASKTTTVHTASGCSKPTANCLAHPPTGRHLGGQVRRDRHPVNNDWCAKWHARNNHGTPARWRVKTRPCTRTYKQVCLLTHGGL